VCPHDYEVDVLLAGVLHDLAVGLAVALLGHELHPGRPGAVPDGVERGRAVFLQGVDGHGVGGARLRVARGDHVEDVEFRPVLAGDVQGVVERAVSALAAVGGHQDAVVHDRV